MHEHITIFGSGFVASGLAAELKNKYKILRFAQFCDSQGVIRINYLRDLSKYEAQVLKSRLVIIAVGTGDLDFCESSVNDCRLQHQTVVADICKVLKNFHNLAAPIVHISSDNVFSSPLKSLCAPTITDVPNPRTVYGKIKRECEFIVANELGGHNLRLPALTYENYHENNIISKYVENIKLSKDFIIDKHLIPRYFTSLSTVANVIQNFDFQASQNKYHHLSNQTGYTYLELAHMIIDCLKIDKKAINLKLENKDIAPRSHIRLVSSFDADPENGMSSILKNYFSNRANFS